MPTAFLFTICVLIWGSTWFVITYQLGVVAPEVSVFYRFTLAAAISFAYCLLRKKKLKFAPRDHLWLALQGMMMFCLNYIFTYHSEKYVSSGLIAVTFTLMVYFNMFGMRLFYGQKIENKVIIGGTLGFIGIFCLFYNDVMAFKTDGMGLKGLFLGIIASVFASAGNLFAVKTRRRNLPVLESNSWGMLYGALLTGVICFINGSELNFSLDPKYIGGLLYLTVFGTIIAFGAYVTLIGRMGAEKSIFVGILTPVLALIISTLFEGFHWTAVTFLGVFLCLSGNAIALLKIKFKA